MRSRCFLAGAVRPEEGYCLKGIHSGTERGQDGNLWNVC